MKKQNVDFKEEIRQKTYDDLMAKLKKYKKCAIIRPTGFGKTWLLAKVIFNYKRVLYLYPAEVVKETVEGRYNDLYLEEMDVDAETLETADFLKDNENVTMMTYAKLVRTKLEEFADMKYDLIIADECHRIGANGTKFALNKLLANNPRAHFIGATATPSRMDGFDVVNVYFNDIMTYEYNVHDAMVDGFLQRPYYCYCSHDFEKDVKDAYEKVIDYDESSDTDDAFVIKEIVKKAIVENANLINMSKIVKEAISEVTRKNQSYMKFIVFFSNHAHMHEKEEEVIGWFTDEFPNHHINPMIVSSETTEYRNNVSELKNLSVRSKTIDLVFCVDMINLGYHVDDITGIIMYRGTHSSIIYSQQLGRVLSSGSDKPGLVIDIVDNMHRMAVYDLGVRENESKIRAREYAAFKGLGLKVGRGNKIVDETGGDTPFAIRDGKVVDLAGNETNFIVTVDNKGHKHIEMNPKYTSPKMKYNCNTLTCEDLIPTGHAASYRELIRKLVAEPVAQRCKQVAELHFKKWCVVNGLDYPITNEQLAELNDPELTREEFKKEFVHIVRKNKLDYPILNAEKLLSIGESGDGMVPMRLFAKVKKVQMDMVLEYLELSKPSGLLLVN